MSNDYYTATGAPATGSPGTSSVMRAEFSAVVAGFDKLPPLTGNANKLIVVNGSATGLAASSKTVPTGDFVGTSDTQTLTNKTISLTSNTLTATSAEIAAAVSDETGTGALVFAGSPALTGTPTAPTAAAATNTTQIATTAHVFAERSNTATLTNKTINASSNTLSNIANASLTNSSVTVGSTNIALGATATTLAGLTSVTSTGFTGALTGNASTATTLATTRTIWGQNFNGGANVTGNLTSVGNITGTAGVTLTATAATLALAATSTNIITASTNGSERVRVASDGKVGIGNTSPGSYYAGASNVVIGTASGESGITIATGTSGTGYLCFADGTTGTDPYRGIVEYVHSTDYMRFSTAGGAKVTIQSDGALRLLGSSSGHVGLKAAAAAGSATYTLPSADGTSGQMLSTNGSGTLSWASASLTIGTPQNTTSGTSIDFTGIPAGTKRITINFAGVSTNGTDNWLVQLGDSGGIETSGYLGVGGGFDAATSFAHTNYTAGFGIRSGSAAVVLHGSMVLTLLNASTNTWAVSGQLANSASAQMYTTAGSKPLSETLDRVRLTTTGGTNTFDAGSINIAYE
jgi:hypothetical protein